MDDLKLQGLDHPCFPFLDPISRKVTTLMYSIWEPYSAADFHFYCSSGRQIRTDLIDISDAREGYIFATPKQGTVQIEIVPVDNIEPKILSDWRVIPEPTEGLYLVGHYCSELWRSLAPVATRAVLNHYFDAGGIYHEREMQTELLFAGQYELLEYHKIPEREQMNLVERALFPSKIPSRHLPSYKKAFLYLHLKGGLRCTFDYYRDLRSGRLSELYQNFFRNWILKPAQKKLIRPLMKLCSEADPVDVMLGVISVTPQSLALLEPEDLREALQLRFPGEVTKACRVK